MARPTNGTGRYAPLESAQGAPTAPVSRGREVSAPRTAAASYTRHTRPQGATIADLLRMLAIWVVRAVRHGLIANSPEGSPIR